MKTKVQKILFTSLVLSPLLLQADMDRCVSCHGVDFEKKALGVSKVVKDMSEQEIKAALDGYKNGQGGAMKELMMQEVNVGVDTDAMAADVYNESHTPGFEEPSESFVFQKRMNVKTLHQLKNRIQNADLKKDMPKISSQIKAMAFSMYAYDPLLREKVNFNDFQPKPSKLNKEALYEKIQKIKTCVDHSFTEEEIVECRVKFMTLAGTMTQNEAQKIKAQQKANKPPVYTGEGAVKLNQ